MASKMHHKKFSYKNFISFSRQNCLIKNARRSSVILGVAGRWPLFWVFGHVIKILIITFFPRFSKENGDVKKNGTWFWDFLWKNFSLFLGGEKECWKKSRETLNFKKGGLAHTGWVKKKTGSCALPVFWSLNSKKSKYIHKEKLLQFPWTVEHWSVFNKPIKSVQYPLAGKLQFL